MFVCKKSNLTASVWRDRQSSRWCIRFRRQLSLYEDFKMPEDGKHKTSYICETNTLKYITYIDLIVVKALSQVLIEGVF